MYVPAQYAETRSDLLHALIDRHPLGTLVSAGAGGLDADHLPFQLAPPGPGAPQCSLRAHAARANPLVREDGAAVLVLFRGASDYVSPLSHDLAARGGRAVPTWNYEVVHVHGRLRVVDDGDWIMAHMQAATARREDAQGGWRIADAPRDYIDKLLRATVGIEIAIERIEGKFKMG
jgi:transcriptional regulator